ncbi:MAG: SAM-dependent chlorinase/fluorinase [Flavobacteriaceae bacterium]|nr:SAM-dependent chlorinase/fluorinase [Flavobacteriaceae bacterium]
MSIITLTSDFGTKDYAVAAVKARLLSLKSDLSIVDISHEIAPYQVVEAAFIVNAIYSQFPSKSIHIIGVDAEQGNTQKHLIVQIDDQIFIGADNGFFSLLQSVSPIQKIIEIKHPSSENSIFPMKDVFCEIAVKIAQQVPLEKFGKTIQTVKEWKQINPDLSNSNEIIGHIVYVDRFGNLITDISKTLFQQKVQNKKFEIKASSSKINKVYNKYDDFAVTESPVEIIKNKAGKAMAVFNSLDLLEIALYKSNPLHGGSASILLGLDVGDSIRIICD